MEEDLTDEDDFEYEDEEPTPFPKDKLFEPEMEEFLQLISEPKPSRQAVQDAMAGMMELQEFDQQWVQWPRRIAEAMKTPYGKGCFKTLRGILRIIDKASGEVQFDAIDLLEAFIRGGSVGTQIPVSFLVECGGVEILCNCVREGYDAKAMKILIDLARSAPLEMLPALISGGAVRTAISLLDSEVPPLDQMGALELLSALCKRAPAQVAKEGAYDAVKAIDNEVLTGRRNKIMNFLRPLVEHKGELSPGTNIRSRVRGLA